MLTLFLDSTYLFPIVDINIVEGWDNISLSKLLDSKDIILHYCDLSIFEIFTKCSKLIIKENLEKNEETLKISEIQMGIDKLLITPELKKINWAEDLTYSKIYLDLKKIHNDSIDCIIFCLAVEHSDCFATFDNTFINKIKKSESILSHIEELNPNFSIWKNDLKKKRVNLIKK